MWGDPSYYYRMQWIWGEVPVIARKWWKEEVADRYLTFSAEESVTLSAIGAIAITEPTAVGEVVWGIAAGGLIGAKILDNIFSGEDDARLLMNEDAEEKSESIKGSKSQEEYDKHVRKLKEAKEEVKKLEEKLKETKGPKKQNPIKEQIKKLLDDVKGHEKEIKQKWPKGRR
jgi:hypothetical protein